VYSHLGTGDRDVEALGASEHGQRPDVETVWVVGTVTPHQHVRADSGGDDDDLLLLALVVIDGADPDLG